MATQQFAEGNSLHVFHEHEWCDPVDTLRLGVQNLRHWKRAAEGAEQIDFFLTQRCIVLIKAKHNWRLPVIELHFEVRVAQVAREWQDSEHPRVSEGSLYDRSQVGW